jgi:hypothetical protein
MIRLQRILDSNTGTHLFEVAFMTWNTFFQAVCHVKDHQNVWDMFRYADCLVGGIDMSIPYL